MQAEMQPTRKHVASIFPKDLSLTYAIKWEDTPFAHLLLQRQSDTRPDTEGHDVW